MDLISIVVPIHNAESYLDRCVQSIAEQSYPDLEIILVDDGSTDHSAGLCRRWTQQDPRIRLIRQPKGGLSQARNLGLRASTGQYIAFVDSDDWIHPSYIQLLHTAAVKYSADISACDLSVTHEYTQTSPIPANLSISPYTPKQALHTLIRGTTFRAVVWNKLYTRRILLDEEFPAGRCHEDEFFTYRVLAKAKRLVYVDTPLYFYYQRPTSITHIPGPAHLDILDAYWQRLSFLKSNYPDLYAEDRITFCKACAHIYISTFDFPGEVGSTARRRIRFLRSRLHISCKELLSYPIPSAIYAAGTQLSLDWFCRLLSKKRAVLP